MIDPTFEPELQEGPEAQLRDRFERLQQESHDARQDWERRIVLAEMKVEAIRAGIVDMDGLKFVDAGNLQMGEDGSVVGAAESIALLKKEKPWLFAVPSSSSVARVPASRPTRHKLATEMTDDEYRIARANIVRHTSF